MDNLIFEYINAAGEQKRYELINWQEKGHYLSGVCILSGNQYKTFRKDRVQEYLTLEDALKDPHPSRPTTLNPKAPMDERPQVLFTGFAKALKIELEDKADIAGLNVIKTRNVGGGLDFLVCGSNAGPKKIEKAMRQNTYIVSEEQFEVLLETGELVDNLS